MMGKTRHNVPSRDDERQVVFTRSSLCLPDLDAGVIVQDGDQIFERDLRRYYATAESNASERTVELKTKLRLANTHDFWVLLMEGMTSIVDAQYGFVAKRILFDDVDSAVEMPPLGEPGSCLMGLAFYFNDGKGQVGMFRDYKYMAYGAPCAHMRHDKVFLVPEHLNRFVPENVNGFPFPADAYLGIPLFAEGKCFAHFGLMWTLEANEKRELSWSFIELFLHSLEDLILQRILVGENFAKPSEDAPTLGKVIPQSAVDRGRQSLRPYARSLSHELRTPMQGVVGMLDVMHSTVQDAAEEVTNEKMKKVFQALRDNIEVVQDSSRRAVEAADNVVHAYDLNMEVPDAPSTSIKDAQHAEGVRQCIASPDVSAKYDVLARSLTFDEETEAEELRSKRRRSGSAESNVKPAAKHRVLDEARTSPHPESAGQERFAEGTVSSANISPRTRALDSQSQSSGLENSSTPVDDDDARSIVELDVVATPGLRQTNLRDLLHYVISESLRVGGRPDSALATETSRGERIETKTRNSKGDATSKLIEWSVDAAVPDTMLVDERDLSKLVSCVFLNALKFTETGKITLEATVSPKSRFILINVKDTGPGIPQDFLPSIFKPFSREDESLTRQTDGLGLGLLVAKGLVRKIGGDLACVRSETSGPNKGTEFEIRIPISPTDASSGRSTPSGGASTPCTSVPRYSLESDLPLDEQVRARVQRRSPSASLAKDGRDPPRSSASTSGPTKSSRSRKSSRPSPPPRKPSTGSDKAAAVATTTASRHATYNKNLSQTHPRTFLVAEDNKINRQLLVTMLSKFGYTQIYEAYDGAEAVRQMEAAHAPAIDVVLMDLWMPNMDGYEATERILALPRYRDSKTKPPTVLAVTADVTRAATEHAGRVGMRGLMTKPYKLVDLEKLILENC